MSQITQALFLDEMDAHAEEYRFSATLDSGTAPLHVDNHVHAGEGATTAYYQSAKLVGLSTRFRDELNRTLLVCVDLR